MRATPNGWQTKHSFMNSRKRQKKVNFLPGRGKKKDRERFGKKKVVFSIWAAAFHRWLDSFQKCWAAGWGSGPGGEGVFGSWCCCWSSSGNCCWSGSASCSSCWLCWPGRTWWSSSSRCLTRFLVLFGQLRYLWPNILCFELNTLPHNGHAVGVGMWTSAMWDRSCRKDLWQMWQMPPLPDEVWPRSWDAIGTEFDPRPAPPPPGLAPIPPTKPPTPVTWVTVRLPTTTLPEMIQTFFSERPKKFSYKK